MTAPGADRAPTVIRLGDLSDIVAAVPHLLGFHPAESLVAVALRGPRERMEFALRLDLPGHDERERVAADVALRMRHAGADGVLLFVFTGEIPAGHELPHADLVEEVAARLRPQLREAVLVSTGRLWSYLCDDDGCCPVEGRPYLPESPGAVALAAAHAFEGRAVLPDRAAVVASVQPFGGVTAASMRQALDRARADRDKAGSEAFVAAVEAEVEALTERYADPPADLSDDEAGRVALALHDIGLRDEILFRLGGDHAPLRALLHDVARRAQPHDDAPVCTCLAWAAYADGDGLLASAALDRALATDRGYSMARLLAEALARQISPAAIRASAAGVQPEEIRSRRPSRRR